jgi:hypothetical protein
MCVSYTWQDEFVVVAHDERYPRRLRYRKRENLVRRETNQKTEEGRQVNRGEETVERGGETVSLSLALALFSLSLFSRSRSSLALLSLSRARALSLYRIPFEQEHGQQLHMLFI